MVEFYRMSGDVDYLLRVVVPDIAAYDAFYKRLIAKIEIRRCVARVLRHGADSSPRAQCRSTTRGSGALSGFRSSSAIRLDVSQRLPPIACASA